MGAVVVAHHVQLYAPMRFGYLLEESQELTVAVPWVAGVRGDASGRDLQRGEQGRCAVADVIVGTSFGLAEADRVRIGHFLSQAPYAWRTVRALANLTGRPVGPVDSAFTAYQGEPGWDPQWTL
jgi:hypothetical protein